MQINEIEPVGYYGDCVIAPYVTAFGEFEAPAGTEATYRWVVDGVKSAGPGPGAGPCITAVI
ncbi:hypothetical protein [Microbispora sp. NPDC046933]|uniref:hypothetical protein n=1 Tax=Microbispora sp. NPDC046933 TaxID=3155618 RepID=UPI0033E40508